MSRLPKKLTDFVVISLLGTLLALLFAGSSRVLAQSPPVAEPIAPTAAHYNLWQAAVLGLIQGVTEFLPISSTAHLKVIPVFLGWGDPGVTFTAIIQLGSIAAVLGYFWLDLTQFATGSFRALARKDYKDNDFRISVGILLGTFPILFFGFLLKKLVPDLDRWGFRSMLTIAIASMVMAILLGLAERYGKRTRGFELLKVSDGIAIGFAQALALIAGVSRSGATMTAGLFLDLERATAARFSFLLGIPAITLAGLVELKTDVIDPGIKISEIYPLLVAVISSTLFSYLSIAWLIDYLKRQSTWVFVWYRLAFALVIFSALALGWIAN